MGIKMKYILMLLLMVFVSCQYTNEEETAQNMGWKDYQYVNDRYLVTDKHGDMYLVYYDGGTETIASKQKIKSCDYDCGKLIIKKEDKVEDVSSDAELKAEIKLLKYKLEQAGDDY